MVLTNIFRANQRKKDINAKLRCYPNYIISDKKRLLDMSG